jgi:tRNA-2-methylthio-N6-dimethylallyladenosine synthase
VKYFIMNLGCQMNLSDSERIQTVIESLGYQRTDQEDEADLLGIVSCSVRPKGHRQGLHQDQPLEQNQGSEE